MTRPGSVVRHGEVVPSRGLTINSGTAFFVGASHSGPVGVAKEIRNTQDFARIFGPGTNYSVLSDAVETYLRSGGKRAYVSRVVGPTATAASVTFENADSAAAMVVSALSPGIWGNAVSVELTTGSDGGFVITVRNGDDGIVEQSYPLADVAAAINWSATSAWVRVTFPNTPAGVPVVPAAAQSLSGGTDNNGGITDSGRIAALDVFNASLGIGQVLVPGNTSPAIHEALAAHAEKFNRVAILDLPNVTTAASLIGAATGSEVNEYCFWSGSWVRTPGPRRGVTRIVPGSAVVAGLIARSDGAKSVNEPAAGDNGLVRYGLDVTAKFTDDEYERLNEAGINMIRQSSSGLALYGFRSATDPVENWEWTNFANVRLRMLMAEQFKRIADRFVFSQIDGGRLKIAQFGGALTAACLEHYEAKALYGATPDEAFIVDVGETVNTDETIANLELHAKVSVRMSPFAELVVIETSKTPITQSL